MTKSPIKSPAKAAAKSVAANAPDPKSVLEEVLGHLKTASESAGDHARDALEEATKLVTESVGKFADTANAETGKLAKKAGKEVKAHPVATAAIGAMAAGLIGLIVAKQLHDKSK